MSLLLFWSGAYQRYSDTNVNLQKVYRIKNDVISQYVRKYNLYQDMEAIFGVGYQVTYDIESDGSLVVYRAYYDIGDPNDRLYSVIYDITAKYTKFLKSHGDFGANLSQNVQYTFDIEAYPNRYMALYDIGDKSLANYQIIIDTEVSYHKRYQVLYDLATS